MSILPCKDKNGRAIKKDGLTKYRVRVSYTISNPDGTSAYKQLERTAYGKPQAQQLEADLAKQAKELESAPTDIPADFSALVDLYLASCTSGKANRSSTVIKKREHADHHLIPFLGTMPLSSITGPVLMSWKDYINAKDSIGLVMRQHCYATLRAILNYAVSRGWYQVSPLNGIENFKDVSVTPQEHEELHFYTAAEFHLFIDGLKQVRPGALLHRFLVMFMVLFFTGARKGEANALKWTDYDPKAGTIYIRRSIDLKAKGGPKEGPPKNKSSYRKIPVPPQLVAFLSEQNAYQRLDPGYSNSWYICGGPAPIPDTTLEAANRAAAKAAGLHHIRIHDFRHSHASLLIEANINIKAISHRLGHSRVQETWNRYGHLYPEADDRIIAALSQV